jgi:predicted lipoprotein
VIRSPRIRTLAVAVIATLVLASAGACSDGDGGGKPAKAGATPEAFLTATANEVIIPSYRALVANLEALDRSLAALCTTPSADGLTAVQAQWRDVDEAFQGTRAGGVGPAIERRLMVSVAFRARPDEVEALVTGTGPLDPVTLGVAGAGVHGIYAVEVAVFGPGSAALTTAEGARRCTFARSATQLATTASQQVLDDWTGPDDVATFARGMDGDRQSSVSALVNEVTFRLQQVDDQGLRGITEASSYADLPASRTEGPAAHGLAALRGVLGGVAAIVLGPDGEPGLVALVRERSEDTADRLESLMRAALQATRPLPDSIAAAFEDGPAVAKAQQAVAALKVLVSTEVASRLGVTIGFSDADGDS